MPTEHDEAVLLTQYLDILAAQGKILLFSHIPHETFTRSWSAKRKNTQEGVRPGVPDYVIITATSVIFLELKRIKGGKLSLEQKRWLNHLPGKQTVTIYAQGFDEARLMLEEVIDK